MKNKTKTILTSSILLATFVLTGCGNNKQASETVADNTLQVSSTIAETTKESQTETASIKTYTFRDVYGKEYEANLITSIKACPYDKNKFTISDDGIMLYGGEGYTQKSGIDVSHYQGDIDWQQVKNAGYEFVILRVGYRGYGEAGTLCMDKKFYEYYEGAKAVGMEIGCYFFAQAVNETEAEEEADYVMNAIKNCKMDLPVVYDPENILNDDARTDNVTGEQFTKNTIAFANRMKTYGYDCMIYSNMLWEAFQYDLTKLTDYPIWYADYEAIPQTPYDFEYWQYTNEGKVPGIQGYVDIDIRLMR